MGVTAWSADRLGDSGCQAIITTDERAELIATLRKDGQALKFTVLANTDGQAGSGLRYDDLVGSAPPAAAPDPEELDETSFIVYTSGTTGRAKGVQLTIHGMLWVTAACWATITDLSENDTVLSPLPLFHSYALNLSVLSILAVGASEYILEKYSTGEVLKLLGSGEFTFFPGVPTMFHYMTQSAKDLDDQDFSHLRLCITAGAIMPATLNIEFEEQFGVPLLDCYGITETSTIVTMNWPNASRVMGSCGLPLPGLATRIIDPADGADVEAGREGELIVRGPNVMKGYHQKPDETAAALRDGWYYTGDLATSDKNGFLTITGRLKELIIRGGQNIAPAEIEEVVNTCAGVLDCAVVAAKHEQLGEVPVVFIVENDDAAVDADTVLEHCRSYLSSYKVPVAVRFVEGIPRTGSGKIIRYKLQEQLAQD